MNFDPSTTSGAPRTRSVLYVAGMDCPSEENLIRLALGNATDISNLNFDLAQRTVTVEHQGDVGALVKAVTPLGLGAELRSSEPVTDNIAHGDLNGMASTLAIPKMDCPSEENMIRMALADIAGIGSLTFDLAGRKLLVIHSGALEPILVKLHALDLGARLVESVPAAASTVQSVDPGDADEARTLRWLLAINGLMFLVEMVWGVIAESTGLIADSLDMFADAAVYGLALYAVGRAAALKVRAAHLAGWLQLILALGALSEVIRRSVMGSEPESASMMVVGAVALIANVTCLVMIAKKRDRGAHMKASYIFSANDVIANMGVIAAGALVTWTGSNYPDLIIGTVIGVIVLNGARRILKLQ